MVKLSPIDERIVEEHGLLLSHDLETLVKLQERNVRNAAIKDSSSSGKGYVATRNIEIGDTVIVVYGVLLGHQTAQHSVQQSMEVHLEPFEMGGRYMNHSCEGNLSVRSSPRGFTQWIAKKPIAKGEELAYSYSLTEFKWAFFASENYVPCACKAPSCEGVIKSFSDLKTEVQMTLVEKKAVSAYLDRWYHQNVARL